MSTESESYLFIIPKKNKEKQANRAYAKRFLHEAQPLLVQNPRNFDVNSSLVLV